MICWTGMGVLVLLGDQLLEVNAAHSNILPSELRENIWKLFLSSAQENTSKHARTLVTQLQHSIQLSGHYHSLPEP